MKKRLAEWLESLKVLDAEDFLPAIYGILYLGPMLALTLSRPTRANKLAILLLAATVPVLAGPAWRYLRERRTRSWLLAKAELAGGHVARLASGMSGSRYLLDITYVYRVSGERYGGLFQRVFSDGGAATRLLEQLRSGPFDVRYDPDNPLSSSLEASETMPKAGPADMLGSSHVA
jgi:hypothetical protein